MLLLASSLLLGCYPNLPKPGDEGPHCEDVATEIGMDETSPLGFAGGEVAPLADGAHDAAFTWQNRPPTTVTVDASVDGGTARYVDSTAVYPDDGTYSAIGVECPDRIELDADLSFSTADGELAEGWAVVLLAYDVTTVAFTEELDLDHLDGTYDIAKDLDTVTGYDSVRAWVDGSFTAAGTTGTVEGQASGEGECDTAEDTCTAWATNVDIGRWGPEDG